LGEQPRASQEAPEIQRRFQILKSFDFDFIALAFSAVSPSGSCGKTFQTGGQAPEVFRRESFPIKPIPPRKQAKFNKSAN
jgi:hypothetical protein